MISKKVLKNSIKLTLPKYLINIKICVLKEVFLDKPVKLVLNL